MKRSVNLNGFQAKHRRITAQDFVDTCRALGMTDEEIKQAVLAMKGATHQWKKQSQPPTSPNYPTR